MKVEASTRHIMLDTALKVLKKLEEHGFSAYIVGGFIRDRLLDIESIDIDITTSATPMEVRKIFKKSILPSESYGSVTLIAKNIHFEITTFRKESGYDDNRRPSNIVYIDTLLDDLLRRDFTINTLCMDSSGKVVDLLGATRDLKDRIIETVGDSDVRFKEDSLRMLRALRFATILDFRLSDSVKKAIINNKESLRSLSYHRKKQELDKIFSSSNVISGVNLIKELGLDSVLGIDNIDNIKEGLDLIGIWASIEADIEYPFTNSEKEIIRAVKEIVKDGYISDFHLYEYDLYICSVACDILGNDRVEVTKRYEELPILSRKDIDIESEDIMRLFGRSGGRYIKDIYDDIEDMILKRGLVNDKQHLINYIVAKHGGMHCESYYDGGVDINE